MREPPTRFLCVYALAWAAGAGLATRAVAADPARFAPERCSAGWNVRAGVHSAYRPTYPTRPNVLDSELARECTLSDGLVAGGWFAPAPYGPGPKIHQAEASGPPWGFVSELRLGLLSHDMAFTGKALAFPDPLRHRHERGFNLSGELLFVSPRIFRYLGSPRPRVGASLNLAGYTDDAYVDLDWGHAFRAGPFVEAFLGGAWHDGALRDANPQRSELGSRLLFHSGLEVGWRLHGHQGVSFVWEHLSNGSLATPNQGLDRFGIRLGYRFDGEGP